MAGPDAQAARPEPLAAEEATAGSLPAQGAAPAPAPEDDDLDFFTAPDDPALADAVTLAVDPALADDGDVAGDDGTAGVLRGGLRWSWELDFETLLAALSEPASWNRLASPAASPDQAPASEPALAPGPAPASEPALASGLDAAVERDLSCEPATAGSGSGSVPDVDPGLPGDHDASAAGVDPVEAEFAEILEAIEAGRSRVMPLAVAAGRVAESLPAGPDLAAWLSGGETAGLEYGALAGMAASYRRLASWAQAGELAVVAHLAARSAGADDKVGVAADGRPAELTDDACAQVSLALTMSQAAASWWSDLAVTLTWRLAATGAALRAGQIDLARARLIADATAVLDEDTARAVEAKILPTAGDQTTGQLRAALRRAVITADPDGADRRREEAERRAKVSLYPDPDGTASLAGYSLPSIRAAAAMARISALAKAMKAAGAGGGTDLLRAQVFLGLLLGTLPYIPPPEDAPPDQPPDDDPGHAPGGESGDLATDDSGEPSDGGPGGQSARPRPSSRPPDNPPLSGRPSRSRDPGRPEPPGPALGRDRPGGQRGTGERGSASRDGPRAGARRTSHDRPGPDHPGLAQRQTGDPDRGRPPASSEGPGPGPAPHDSGLGPAPPEPDGLPPDEPDQAPREASCADDDFGTGSRPPPAWPPVPPLLPSGPAAMGRLQPAAGGLLDLTVPWSTLTGDSGEPGHLSQIGPITPSQARDLADLASYDPAVSWRVIITSPDGTATAVRRVPTLPGSSGPAGLIRRVSVSMRPQQLSGPPSPGLPAIWARTLRAAARAAEEARLKALADTAAGGCAHTLATPAYQPPPRLRELITARDGTCRFPTCRQPVWRCDLDHCTPYHRGGRTCSCNLGGLCRFHHILKQHHLWQLIQPTPGTFAWVTPAGRTYYTQPDSHAA